MKFVINDLLYDTEKMEHIAKVQKWYKNNFMSAVMKKDVGSLYPCDLYKSKHNRYLVVRKSDYDSYIGEAITEAEAKELLKKADLTKCQELFGEFKEA